MLVFVDEQPVLRQHHHHARALDFVDLRNGAGQFTLQGPDIVGPLDEVRYAEVRFVEDLEADAIAVAGNAFAGELHPHEMDFLGRHKDRTAAGTDFVGDFGIIQCGDDLGGLAIREFAVKEAVIGSARPPGNGQDGGHQHPGGQRDTDALAGSQLLPDILELAPDFGCVRIHLLAVKPACA